MIVVVAAAFYIGRRIGINYTPNAVLNDSIISEVSDSISAKDTLSNEEEKIVTEETDKGGAEKPTVQEQIKKQVEQKSDTATSEPSGLTKIEKGNKGAKTENEANSELTPIKDKMKNVPIEDPLSPVNPKKDNITENPLNNQ